MYSGKFPCSLIIKSKKRVSSTKDYSAHIRTQINIDPVAPVKWSWTVHEWFLKYKTKDNLMPSYIF